MIPLFYFVNWSLQAKRATDFLKYTGLEAKIVDLREFPLFINYYEKKFSYDKIRLGLILSGELIFKGLSEINKYLDLLCYDHS
jgi:hypothetical protein